MASLSLLEALADVPDPRPGKGDATLFLDDEPAVG
jgi:hypothetical protein